MLVLGRLRFPDHHSMEEVRGSNPRQMPYPADGPWAWRMVPLQAAFSVAVTSRTSLDSSSRRELTSP
jgi:hypothetical protein